MERASTLPPSSIIYRTRRYDFDPSIADGLDLIQAGTLRAALTLARSVVTEVEINEPLMRVGLRRSAILLASVRLASRFRRQPIRVVSYAIENRDPFRPGTPESFRGRAARSFDRQLAKSVARRIDRLVYGTDAAHDLYEQLLGRALVRTQTRVVQALPAPCKCNPDLQVDPHLVLFVGALTTRKGFDRLLSVWPQVREIDPLLRLQIVGKGLLEDQAFSAAANDPSVSVSVDPPRSEIHQHLRRAAALVLLSMPAPQWKEQVGLPIVEALAHGCVVVTTTETGLAQWLMNHHHLIVSPDASDELLVKAIISAVRSPKIDDHKQSLPEVDGRIAADAWLFDPRI